MTGIDFEKCVCLFFLSLVCVLVFFLSLCVTFRFSRRWRTCAITKSMCQMSKVNYTHTEWLTLIYYFHKVTYAHALVFIAYGFSLSSVRFCRLVLCLWFLICLLSLYHYNGSFSCKLDKRWYLLSDERVLTTQNRL